MIKSGTIKRKLIQEMSYVSGKYIISPEIVSLVVTYRCNFRCKACTVWRMGGYPELSESEWMGIAGKLENALSGQTTIEISGGEPLIRKDLVVHLIKELKFFFKNVGINSNGSMLDEEMIVALKNAGLDYMKLSLYSFDDEIHDALRGFSGAAKCVKRAIDLLQKHGVRTDVGVLMTAENVSGIHKLIEHYNQPKYSEVSIVLQPLDEPIGNQPISGEDKISTINNLWPDKSMVSDFFSWLKSNDVKIKNSDVSLRAIEKYYSDRTSALDRRCFAGQRNLVVYPDGRISFCYKGKTLGNVAKYELEDIISGKTASEERKNIKRCPYYCRIVGCNFSKTISEILKIS